MKNFFQELQIDDDLPIHVLSADLYQDAAQKVDFIIKRHHHHRGVDVKDQQIESVGMQFTITRGSLARKKEQIAETRRRLRPTDRIDDVLLVRLPLRSIEELWDRWNSEGRPPGGPQQYWDEQTKEIVFRGVLEGMMNKEEIDSLWQQVKGSEEEPASEVLAA